VQPTRYAPPACNKPTSQAWIAGPGIDSACTDHLPSLKFVSDTLSVSALIGRMTLTQDLLTSNLVHIIARRVGNLPTTFGIPGAFCSWLMSQHLLDRPRDLATLTFNLGDHGACGWYGSSCSISVPRLNFVGLPIRKMTHFRSHIISKLVTLTFDLETGAYYCPWKITWCIWQMLDDKSRTKRPINTKIGRKVAHLSDASRDLATLTFDVGGHGSCRWYGSSWSICVPSLKFVGLSVREIWYTSCLSISRPGDLDLWPLNWCALVWTTLLPILVFLCLYLLDLWANTYQTHHVTLRPWPFILEVMALVGDSGLLAPFVYQVWLS